MSAERDPLGLDLLEARIAQAPNLARATWECTQAQATAGTSLAGRAFCVTGVGSSEAHARFLVHLLQQYAGAAARYVPFSAFFQGNFHAPRAEHLVLFSQGLSPNAQLCLHRRSAFTGLTLFTAASVKGLHGAGKGDRAALLAQLLEEGAERVYFPLAEEFSILLRVIGPLCGYVAAGRWLRQQFPDAGLPAPDWDRLAEAGAEAAWTADRPSFADAVRAYTGGVALYTLCGALCEYAQNLSYKRVEGVFLDPVPIQDVFAFSHGPFQQQRARPTHAPWFLGCGDASEDALIEAVAPLVDHLGQPLVRWTSPLPEPWSILAFEQLFNALALAAARERGVDQRNWPGRGEDGAAYSLSRPCD